MTQPRLSGWYRGFSRYCLTPAVAAWRGRSVLSASITTSVWPSRTLPWRRRWLQIRRRLSSPPERPVGIRSKILLEDGRSIRWRCSTLHCSHRGRDLLLLLLARCVRARARARLQQVAKRFLLEACDLFYAPGMPTSLKVGLQPDF